MSLLDRIFSDEPMPLTERLFGKIERDFKRARLASPSTDSEGPSIGTNAVSIIGGIVTGLALGWPVAGAVLGLSFLPGLAFVVGTALVARKMIGGVIMPSFNMKDALKNSDGEQIDLNDHTVYGNPQDLAYLKATQMAIDSITERYNYYADLPKNIAAKVSRYANDAEKMMDRFRIVDKSDNTALSVPLLRHFKDEHGRDTKTPVQTFRLPAPTAGELSSPDV